MSLQRSRIMGSLYGCVVGDALGAPYEFKTRYSYNPSGDMVDCFTFGKMPPGTWTDDSSMLLCLAQSLIDCNGFVWEDAAKKWVRWLDEAYMSVNGIVFDVGIATRTALMQWQQLQKEGKPFPEEPNANPQRSFSGNGSIMRLAPLPIVYHADPATALVKSALSSRVTHSSTLCIDCCVLMASYIIGFLTAPETDPQKAKQRILNPSFTPLPSGEPIPLTTPEIKEIHTKAPYQEKEVDEIKTSGFCLSTLEAALWALWYAEDFEHGMLLLLPLGLDVDTVCAVYGQLAGACFGLEGIPARWMKALQAKDLLEDVFDKLLALAESGPSPHPSIPTS